MKTAIKSTLAIAATAAAIAGVAAVPAMVSAFSRPLYSYQYVNEHDVGVTFNSIKVSDTDAAWAAQNNLAMPIITNETNFVGAREDTGKNEGVKNVWEGTEITAEDGKTYIVRLYVHNNSQKQEAKDVQVRFYVPYGSGTSVTVDGDLRSSNATPNQYLDDVTFKSANGSPFHLEYVSGSAFLENGGFASGAGVKLPDSIVNQGNNGGSANGEWTTIGYNGLDGVIPGCYKYTNYVGIRVKAVYDYDYTVEKKVRIVGDTDKTWKESVEAKVGDKVEFQIQYKNTSNYTQENVAIKDVLPSNLRYVDGSAKLYNVLYPNGATFTEGTIVTTGVRIGNYTAGSNAFIRLTAEVVNDNLECGMNTLYNWGQAGVGNKVIQDDAQVKVTRVCETPTTPDEPTPEEPETPVIKDEELPKTGPTAIAGGVIAAGSIATAAGYYIASRRQLR